LKKKSGLEQILSEKNSPVRKNESVAKRLNIIEKNLTNLEHVQVYDILKELEKKQPPLRSRLNYESQNCGNDNKIKKNSKEKN
jgi:hypothetical protein